MARKSKWTNRKLWQLLLIICGIWFITTLVIYISIDYYHPSNSSTHNLSEDRLRELMMDDTMNFMIEDPIGRLVLREEKLLSFFHLPKRLFKQQYGELTSANRDTSYPLAPDFTFHIQYHTDHVVLYEDHGPGCMYRIYFFPDLPRDASVIHKMTASDLQDLKLHIDIDGFTSIYSLKDLQLGDKFPFVYPINTRHEQPSSGIGMYTPFCYQNYAKVSFFPKDPLPADLFAQNVNCTKNDLWCDVHIYSAVSRHKFPAGTKVKSYREEHTKTQPLENLAALLMHPDRFGPDRAYACVLQCTRLSVGNSQTIFQDSKAGVITSLRVRVLNTVFGHAKAAEHWSQIVIKFQFDGQKEWKVPLGVLFSATSSSQNDHMGAALGRRTKYCSYQNTDIDSEHTIPTNVMTGYIYFPMPYWYKAAVTLEGVTGLAENTILCYQVVKTNNYYSEDTTGYFTGSTSYYGDDVSGWRNFLTLDNSWGHIVAILMEIDDLMAKRNVALNERWAALQSDMVVYIDDSKSATVIGTGLEDYFSYAHGFSFAENTSYSFVGVPYSAPRRKEPLSWHCYRQHVFDPIPFHKSVRFMMEGTDRERFQQPTESLTYEEFFKLQQSQSNRFTQTVLYYAKQKSGLRLLDKLIFGNKEVENSHDLDIKDSISLQTIENVHFIGASYENAEFTEKYYNFTDLQTIKFKLTVPYSVIGISKGLILRRHFYAPINKWNERATIRINGKNLGTWFIPYGSLTHEYCLKHDDFVIDILSVLGENNRKDLVLDIDIQPHSEWNDIGYYLFAIT